MTRPLRIWAMALIVAVAGSVTTALAAPAPATSQSTTRYAPMSMEDCAALHESLAAVARATRAGVYRRPHELGPTGRLRTTVSSS
jgi:hypothetical protein